MWTGGLRPGDRVDLLEPLLEMALVILGDADTAPIACDFIEEHLPGALSPERQVLVQLVSPEQPPWLPPACAVVNTGWAWMVPL
jgi:hypothetical protein